MSLARRRGTADEPGRSRFDGLRFRVAADLGREVRPEELLGLLLDYAEGDEATFLAWVARQDGRGL